jgi:hypothetical protein
MSPASIAYLMLVVFAFGAFTVVLFTGYVVTNLPPRRPKAMRHRVPVRIERGAERRKAA